MNTFGLRPPSGAGGEDVYLIGPVTAEINTVLSTSVDSLISTDVSGIILSSDIIDALTVNIEEVILTVEICNE